MTKELKELSPAAEATLVALSKQAREAELKSNFEEAERLLLAAWAVIPEPKLDYIRGQISSVSMVKFYRDNARFEKARDWLEIMSRSYGSPTDPYVMLLSGTVAYEAGDLEAAAQVFGSLYAEDGARPFDAIDPKYLTFIKSRVRKGRK